MATVTGTLGARSRRALPSACSEDVKTFHRTASDSSLCSSQRSLARRTVCLPGPGGQPKPQQPVGVSVAYLQKFHVEQRPPEDAPPERSTTRGVALALKRRQQETELAGPLIEHLQGERHVTTGGELAGPATIHVAHAWDVAFAELAYCVCKDSAGEVDQRYSIDIFSTDLGTPASDPIAVVQSTVSGAREVLLVLDSKGIALNRLWVLFEALLASDAGKLRVRPGEAAGFGDSPAALRQWEARIDATDWVLAQATRSSDEKRLRAHTQRVWEMHGKGVERMLAQLKKLLRREVYGQILVAAVEKGDLLAVEACIESGTDPGQQDVFGNTVEELASANDFTEIEEYLFEKRLGRAPSRSLSSFFEPKDLLAACTSVSQDVLAPFLTELEASSDGEQEGGASGERTAAVTFDLDPSSDRPFSSPQRRDALGFAGMGDDARSMRYDLTA